MYYGAMDVVKETGWFFGWNAYDEVIFEVPKSEGEAAMKLIPEKLCHGSSSEWTEGLPLEVEGGLFDHYTK
jgi:DNA polymerase I-like protein with 3'-5' exonuclease and polymerase domains